MAATNYKHGNEMPNCVELIGSSEQHRERKREVLPPPYPRSRNWVFHRRGIHGETMVGLVPLSHQSLLLIVYCFEGVVDLKLFLVLRY